MKIRHLRSGCIVAAIAFATVPTLAMAEPGNMMKITVTTKVDVPGLPSSMPAQTHTVNECTGKTMPDPRSFMKERKQCKVTNYHKVGDTIGYHVDCSGDVQMAGDASFTFHNDSSVQGKIKMAGNTHGQQMAMDMTYNGVRTGSCDYTPPSAH